MILLIWFLPDDFQIILLPGKYESTFNWSTVVPQQVVSTFSIEGLTEYENCTTGDSMAFESLPTLSGSIDCTFLSFDSDSRFRMFSSLLILCSFAIGLA